MGVYAASSYELFRGFCKLGVLFVDVIAITPTILAGLHY